MPWVERIFRDQSPGFAELINIFSSGAGFVEDPHISGLINSDTIDFFKFFTCSYFLQLAFCTPRFDQGTGFGELCNDVISDIADIDLPSQRTGGVIDCYKGRGSELPRRGARKAFLALRSTCFKFPSPRYAPAPSTNKRAIRFKLVNTIITRVSDIDVPCSVVHRDAFRAFELAGPRPRSAKRRRSARFVTHKSRSGRRKDHSPAERDDADRHRQDQPSNAHALPLPSGQPPGRPSLPSVGRATLARAGGWQNGTMRHSRGVCARER